MASNFVIYRSSAGSGKTFTLAKEYLKLALQDPYYFRHILAVTFTNKATAEMKERIISKLYAFSKGDDEAPFHDLCHDLHLRPEELAKRSQEALEKILHQYHRFSILTIDAFFQRIVRSFSREMGLPGNYQVEIDLEKLKTLLLEDVFAALEEHPNLKSWITQYSMDMLQEGRWDVRLNLGSLVDQLFQEEFWQYANLMPDISNDLEQLAAWQEAWQRIIKAYEQELKHVGQTAVGLIKRYDLEKVLKRGIPTFFENLITGDFELKSTIQKAYLDNDWYAKARKADEKQRADEALEAGLRALLERVVLYYEEHSRHYTTAKLIMEHFPVMAILSFLENRVREIQREEELLSNQDIARFLFQIIEQNESPFIYEKVGSFYQNFLIDEFQDTSGMQWSNFRPLIENSLAEGHFNMVVGDVKQSIYRWRSGDLELLLEKIKEDIGPAFTEERELDENYRSKTNIVHFNNAVFGLATQKITQHLVEALQASDVEIDEKIALEAEVEKLGKAYEAVQQKLIKNDAEFPGYIRFTKTQNPRSRGNSFWEEVPEEVAHQIQSLHERGVAYRDMAILVRGNKDGAKLITQVMQTHPDIPFLSNEALFIDNSPAVRVILSALRFIYNAEDTLALLELFYYARFLQDPKALSGEQWRYALSTEKLLEALPNAFTEAYESWGHLDLMDMVGRISKAFQLDAYKGQYAFLHAFESVIASFVQKEKGELGTFINWWTEKGIKKSIEVPDNLDAVKVMTIHKSKGLQFKVVFLPKLDWELDQESSGINREIIWATARDESFAQIPFYPVAYKKDLGNSFFIKDYLNERVKKNLDNLNLLYVAFTRAEEGLYIYAPGKSKKGESNPMSAVNALMEEIVDEVSDGAWNEDNTVWEWGNPDHIAPSKKEKEAVEDEILALQEYVQNSWQERVKVKPLNIRFRDSEKGKRVDMGIMLHELLAGVFHAGELDARLQEMELSGALDAEEYQQLEKQARKMLQHPQMKAWFGGEWQVKTEAPILLPNGAEKRLDRVMTRGEEAIVVDYKTGKKTEKNKEQVQEYMELLKALGYQKVTGFLVYLETVAVEEVPAT